MKVVLGALLLVVLFVSATLWQKHWTSAARAERNRVLEAASPGPRDIADGWSRVIVGRPSGAEPYRGPAQPVPTPRLAPGMENVPQPAAVPPPSIPASKSGRVIVQPGQSLSRICSAHYGTARLEVVDGVARHNRLVDADSLREGQELELPPLETLLPKH